MPEKAWNLKMESQYSPGGRVDKAIEDGWKKQVLRVIAHVDLDAFYSQVRNMIIK